MKKYLIAILCGLIFTVAIGWAAETFDRYKDLLAQSRRIQSLESKVADLEDHVKGLEDGLQTLQLRVQEMAIQLR
jgi:cell division protein FtsB